MLPYIDTPYKWAASLIGASSDELKLLSLFIASYPLSGLLKRIPDSKPWQKNIFIISVGVFYLVGLFDLWTGLYTIVLSSAVAYGIAASMRDPLMPWVAFIALMGHMSISHIYRQIKNDPNGVDITGAQMVLVMKLTSFCWNVHDGRLKDEDLSDFQKERAIKAMPDLLDFFGYVFFFPSLMAGPAFDYVEYTKYISTAMFDLPPGVDPAKAPPRRKQRRIPRSGTPAMIKMAVGLFWILLYLQMSPIYTTDLLLSDEFLTYPFIRRVWNLHLFGFAARTKYYGVWALTEGACILSGIGYSGFNVKTGHANWDRVVNVKPLEIETAQNTRAYIGAWNINTNNWLRNYIFLRVTPKGRKPGFRATMATFVTSAMWHGFYPGYYMTFVLASFVQNVAKNGRRYIRPFFLSTSGDQTPLPRKRYYDIFTWLLTQVTFSFVVAPFVLLRTSNSLEVWGRVYYYAIIGTLAGMAVFASPVRGILSSKSKARMERPGIARTRSDASGAHDVMFGVPVDAEAELQELVDEVRSEIERRKALGLQVPNVKALVQERLAKMGSEVSKAVESEAKKEVEKKEL
ncbi:MBOAT family protein [Microthyrium microscopicum]|uniref:MBOAT family protein n=1 Tax=Microthyrium microscopicum TaxID=703497 RepID=A0A6A6U468_9PEZI|nr:MBOAT family protein [Microthyrium microscopicum]